LTFVREDHELPRHELAAVVIAHRPGGEQQLSLLDLALEERLAGPGTLEQAARIPQHRAEHPQALARRQHARAHDAAHARHLLPPRGGAPPPPPQPPPPRPRPPPPPPGPGGRRACGAGAPPPGRHSSEYISTATSPRSPPPADGGAAAA